MRLAALLLAVALAACGGGGGSSSSGSITPAPALRTDLLYGYYGGESPYVFEQTDHANLFFAAAWSQTDQMAALTQARGQFKAIVLALPSFGNETDLRFYFDRLARAGLLQGVTALYPVDEPDLAGMSDAQVTAQNVTVRKVAADYLPDVKLAVIYSCGQNVRPGIASYDWIGCDDYGRGCGALAYLDGIKAQLRPEQRLIAVPGGADPWRQDPACFESYAHGTPQVVALMPFIWQTAGGGGIRGIREGPVRGLYVAAGKKIKG